jgi:anti-sigma B factor antagonist
VVDAVAVSLAVSAVGPRTVVAASGDLDLSTQAALRQALHELIEQGTTDIIVDLTGATFIDSTVLGVLIGAQNRLRPLGSALVLVSPHERILKIFRLTGLDRVFTIHESVEAAASQTDADPGE